MIVVSSNQTNLTTKQIGKMISEIVTPYIKENLVGYRPLVAYYRAIENNEILLAMDGVQLIGFLHYHKLKRLNTIRIYAIAIKDRYRKMGIGTELIKTLHSTYKLSIITEINPKNNPSVCFFTKCGYSYKGSKDHTKYVTSIYQRDKNV